MPEVRSESSYSTIIRTPDTNYNLNLFTGPYAELLADDFRFYFDEGTRQQNSSLPVFWIRSEDAVQTQGLFESDQVSDIDVELQYGAGQPVNEAGRESWVLLSVLDTFLAVDLKPQPGELEGLTLRVDGQRNDFYFRKGKTAADTLATSDTAKLWYLVEWRDHGQGNFSAPEVLTQESTWGAVKSLYNRKGELLIENTTWSRVKSLFREGEGAAVEPATWGGIKALYRKGEFPAIEKSTWGSVKSRLSLEGL